MKKNEGERRPVRGHSSPLDGGQASAPVQLSSPLCDPACHPGKRQRHSEAAVPSTPKAFQATKDIWSLPVRPTPANDMLRSGVNPLWDHHRCSTFPRHRACPTSAHQSNATGLPGRVPGVVLQTLDSVPRDPGVVCWLSGADLWRCIASPQSPSTSPWSGEVNLQACGTTLESPDAGPQSPVTGLQFASTDPCGQGH